jgi:hypothetical protein
MMWWGQTPPILYYGLPKLDETEDESHLFDVDYHDPTGRKWEACEQAYHFWSLFYPAKELLLFLTIVI